MIKVDLSGARKTKALLPGKRVQREYGKSRGQELGRWGESSCPPPAQKC